MGKYISILYRQEQKNINLAMKQYKLSYSSYNFLIYISKNEGASQKKICQTLAIDEALATRVMGKLEKQGFIIRKREKQNPRSYSLYLTKKGQEIIPKLTHILYQWWENVTYELDKNQLETLIVQLEHIAEKALIAKIPDYK